MITNEIHIIELESYPRVIAIQCVKGGPIWYYAGKCITHWKNRGKVKPLLSLDHSKALVYCAHDWKMLQRDREFVFGAILGVHKP
jgi:hypothetical protein